MKLHLLAEYIVPNTQAFLLLERPFFRMYIAATPMVGSMKAYLYLLPVMKILAFLAKTSDGSNGMQSSELMELIEKFPTSAFVAGRYTKLVGGLTMGDLF